jgi:pimeloyl-ACP methyl ester carboxylesterase
VTEAALVGVGLSAAAFLFESIGELVLRNARLSPWFRNALPSIVFLCFLGVVMPLEAIHPLRTVPKRTPAVVGLAYEDVRFAAGDRVELAGWLVPHSDARGNVIFCHGHGRNREQETGFLPTLHELGLNVLAFDFRGHGDSDGHSATFGCKEVQDLTAAEAYLSTRFPGKPTFIVGVSYGAAVTLQALPQLPRVQAVWCEGCFARLSSVIENQFALVPQALRRPVVATYQVLGWLDCGFWVSDINPIDGLARIRIPIYFCHGVDDELVPFTEGEKLYESYAGPKWNYWVADANHYDLRRRNKEEYLFRLREFLEKSISSLAGKPLYAGAS